MFPGCFIVGSSQHPSFYRYLQSTPFLFVFLNGLWKDLEILLVLWVGMWRVWYKYFVLLSPLAVTQWTSASGDPGPEQEIIFSLGGRNFLKSIINWAFYFSSTDYLDLAGNSTRVGSKRENETKIRITRNSEDNLCFKCRKKVQLKWCIIRI